MNERADENGVGRRADVLVLTADQDEFDAVLALGETGRRAWAETRDAAGFRLYRREFVGKQGTFTVAAAWIGEAGTRAAAIRGAKLLDELDPSCLAMCGVCAGYRKEVSLGDIIVADQIWTADEGKRVIEEGKRAVFYHAPHMFDMKAQWAMDAAFLAQEFDTSALHAVRPPSRDAQRRWMLHTLYAHETEGKPAPSKHPDRARLCPAWTELFREAEKDGLLVRKGASITLTEAGKDTVEEDLVHYPDGLPEDLPLRVHIGAIATVSAEVEDPGIFDRLRIPVRNTMGLEMTGTAIGDLARRFNKQSILIKAVHNFADGARDEAFRPFACRAAAEFLFAFIEKHFKPERAKSGIMRASNSTNDDRDNVVMRNRLYDALRKLSPPELNTLIFKLNIPTEFLPGKDAPPAERMMGVIEWAEPRGRFADIEQSCRELLGDNALPR